VSDPEHASVLDAMHRGVITCGAESSALSVARVMAAHRVHCVVVKSADGPRLVTDRDVAGAIYDEQLETLSADELSRPAPLLRPEDTLAFALERMHEYGTSHAVVVGSAHRLFGVISVLDLVEWMLRSGGRREVRVSTDSAQSSTGRAPCGAETRGSSGIKAEYAQLTNPDEETGTADDVLAGADVYIGLSAPGAVTARGIGRMAEDPIVFAMANPTPEILPEEIELVAAVIATGRSDYSNQINNVLAFPGIFRGALDVRAPVITEAMKLAAARAIADAIPLQELSADDIVPSVFNGDVSPRVAAAVAEAAVGLP
jgi:CBS domain-containing protein